MIKLLPNKKIAVFLLATKKEFEVGLVNQCIEAYLNKIPSAKYCIDFFIFFNQLHDEYESLNKFSFHHNVNSLIIHSYDYSLAEDVYVRTSREINSNVHAAKHPLGGSGGANLLFFESIFSLFNQKHENFLLIECDSRPIKDYWFDSLLNNIKDLQFLIFGSSYKGQQDLPLYESWTGHLNGIAIYKNSLHTNNLLQFAKKFIQSAVKNNINKFISFDVGIWLSAQTLTWKKYLKNNDINFNFLIDSEVISNYSLYADINLSESEILKRNPKTIILHQKWN